MGSEAVRIALVLLEDRQSRFALQLRSPIASIANPDRWGFFGGHVDPGETPRSGAVREIKEELNCSLDPAKLNEVEVFNLRADMRYFVFHYPVETELEGAELLEGEDFDLFSVAEILGGIIRGKEVVGHHVEVLKRFRARRSIAAD